MDSQLGGESFRDRIESCGFISRICSNGVWNLPSGQSLLDSSLTLLSLQLAVIIITTSTLHFFLKRFNFPRISSEMLAGLLLGPRMFGRLLGPETRALVYSPDSERMIVEIAKFGFLMFYFLIAAKLDMKSLGQSKAIAWATGFGGFITCIIIVMPISGMMTRNLDPALSQWLGILIWSTLITQFPLIAYLLIDMKLINSDIGRLALSSSFVGYVVGNIFLTLANPLRVIQVISLRSGLTHLFLTIILLAFILCVLRPIVLWIIRRTPEGKPVKDVYIIIVVLMVFFIASTFSNLGLNYMLGPFIIGLCVPSGPPLASTLVDKFDTITTAFLLPLVPTYCGLKSDIVEFFQKPMDIQAQNVMLFVLVTKIVTTYIPAVLCRMSFRDAAAFALIINNKGIIDFAILMVYETSTIKVETFTAATCNILIYATLFPILINKIYDPSRQYAVNQRRNILHCSEDTGLRILACAYRQEDAVSAIKLLLEVSNSVKASPLCVYGLNLEELIGKTCPVLINHQLGQKNSSGNSRSQHIIDVFTYFKQHHQGFVNVQFFTAISPPIVMYNDICWLALDKQANLIVLPFHRKWSTKGKLVSDNSTLRNLNIDVLDKAPCSVGILIDRRRTRGPTCIFENLSSHSMAVLYFGGNDDREALSYAKRMAKSQIVRLTVYRFVSLEEANNMENKYLGWDKMLDVEFLQDLKRSTAQSVNITFEEKVVRDGADTGSIVQSLENTHDLIMVGRRHQPDLASISGLSDWSEFPELGPVGDLLASSYSQSHVSVFVVQQQFIPAK